VGNLKSKTTNAAIWSTLDKFLEQGIRFIIGLFVARLLFPSDYGLIGMIAIFLAIPDVLVNSGFGSALIQKKSANDSDFSTVFYFNICVGVIVYLILYLTAPLIADFYQEPQLILITRVVGLTIIINSFALVQRTFLTKNLNFKVQTKISFFSILPSGIIGILFAYYGYGVWAIVFQSLSSRILTTSFFWIFNNWRPKLVFNLQSLKSLFSFGSNLLAAGIFYTIFSRIYTVVIGKFYDAESLGNYTKAYQIARMPANSITSIIERIAFPVFSTLQNDIDKLLIGFRKFARIAAFINFPIMIGLIVLSEPLVRLILTDKWLQIVPYIQVICIGGLIIPLHTLSLSIIKAKGDSKIFLRLEFVKNIISTIVIFIIYRWGIMAIIYSNVVLAYLFLYVNFYFAGKKMNFTFGKHLVDLLPYFGMSLITMVIMYISGYFLSSDILKLLVPTITGILVYGLLSRFFKVEAYTESMIILHKIKSKFTK